MEDHPTRPLDEPGPPDPSLRERHGSDFGHPPAPCRKCAGDRIWANVPGYSASGYLVVERIVKVGGLRGTKPKRTRCAALVCIECGYTELYAHKPKGLLEP